MKIVKASPDVKTPEYATQGSAAFDLRAYLPDGSITVRAGETVLVGTGLFMEPDAGHGVFLLPRSGLGLKGLVLGNLVGLCDEDYTGEYKIIVWNRLGDGEFTIHNGDRIAQAVVMPVVRVQFSVVESLTETVRGAGGFGHSGV